MRVLLTPVADVRGMRLGLDGSHAGPSFLGAIFRSPPTSLDAALGRDSRVGAKAVVSWSESLISPSDDVVMSRGMSLSQLMKSMAAASTSVKWRCEH